MRCDHSQLPKSGGVLFSLTDRDKLIGSQIARELTRLGFQLYATESTANFFRAEGLEVSDEELNAQIYVIPAFQENGRFSMKRYQEFLKRQGMPMRRPG